MCDKLSERRKIQNRRPDTHRSRDRKKPVIKKLTRPDDKKNAAETGFSGNRVDEEFSKAAKGGTDAIDHIYEALRLLSKVGVFKEDDKGYPAADRVNDIETAIAAIKAVRPELEERKKQGDIHAEKALKALELLDCDNPVNGIELKKALGYDDRKHIKSFIESLASGKEITSADVYNILKDVPGVDNQAKENAFRVLFGGRRVVDSRLIRVVLENLECVLGEEGLRDLVFTRPHVLASPYLRRNLGLLRDKGMEFLYLKDPGVFVHEKLEETLCVFDAMALDSLYRESPSILSEGLKARDRLIKDAVASLGDRHFLSSIEGYAERLAEKGLSGEEVRRLISLSTYTTDSGTPTAAALKAREILLKAYLTRRGDVLNFYSGYMSLLKEAKFRRHYTEVKSALSYLRDYEPGALIVMRLAASLEKEYGAP